ncbi:exopolysaccharide production protein ExoZ [Rhizobium sp. RU20A]|uniref:acyltransferase family protein n=1 Tax=Rhizobium sp. RU20A TaxID=1907412 RepID=UPI000953FD0F|nr:acyltransferase [Rhizobium sp. RU20A]SIQ18382.1 exopolysaccharide production protein ExoZ [Rhizobium sp. RU20A]
MEPAGRAYFRSIHVLRGAAAFSVLLFHLHVQLTRMGYDGWWPQFLQSGVDLFFVISGFVMWQTTADRKVGLIDFYARRLRRIAPLYWMMTAAIVFVALLVPSALQSTQITLWHTVASYLFIPSLMPGDTIVAPVLVPGWTLNYEMFFYAVFGACLWMPTIWRLRVVPTLLVAIVLAGLVFRPQASALAFWTSPIILEFGLGIIAGYMASSVNFTNGALARLFILSLAVVIGTGNLELGDGRWLLHGLPAAIMMLSLVGIERAGALPRLTVLSRLGDCSYSLYLSHGLVLSAVAQGWRGMGWSGSVAAWLSYMLFAVAAAVLVGWLIYHLVEKPATEMVSSRRTPAAA